jgi:colanic acid/amylovoran biosynthesis glycosyltransferase
MNIAFAYLCGEYPRATDTFIQREVASLRKAGLRVETIAIRRPTRQEQGSIEQWQERRQTHYLLPCGPWSLLADHFGLLLRAPGRYLRSLWLAISVRSPGLRALLYQLFYFAEAGMVAAHMKRRGLTHLHNHAPDSSGYVAMLAAELGNFTYSMTIHGFGILSEPRRWRLKEKLQRSLFTICVSQHARSQAMLWSNHSCWDQLHVVHCGINSEQVESPAPDRHMGRGKHILFVGRFDHVKGLPLLLAAFAVLASRHPEVHLDLVGDGPQRSDLEALVREKGLIERVTFHGYRSQAELREDYARADVFAMTSFAEGIPVVLMEAMAHGVPVVAPRITGIPELVEDRINGLLTTPGDVDDLVDQIEALLADPDLRNRLATAGHQIVAEQFNLETETRRLVGVIRSYLTDFPAHD